MLSQLFAQNQRLAIFSFRLKQRSLFDANLHCRTAVFERVLQEFVSFFKPMEPLCEKGAGIERFSRAGGTRNRVDGD
jgi:hypothetical protein